MKIYVFGNPYFKEDNAPLKILPELEHELPENEFILTDPNENFPPEGERNLIIIDTIKGIKKPTLFTLTDLLEIQKSPNSPHDYDLGLHLLLLKKIKRVDSVKIIGVPSSFDKSKLTKHLKKIISTLL